MMSMKRRMRWFVSFGMTVVCGLMRAESCEMHAADPMVSAAMINASHRMVLNGRRSVVDTSRKGLILAVLLLLLKLKLKLE